MDSIEGGEERRRRKAHARKKTRLGFGAASFIT
jgi:hypothetical protein